MEFLANGERLIWADAARGLLILIVVLGHTLQHGDYEHNIAWNVIYSFHMAAFFIISGYVSYKSELKWSTLQRRAKQLLVPFFLWSFIKSICLKNAGLQLFEFILHPDRGFWFLYSLFFVIVLLTISIKFSEVCKIRALLVVVCVGIMLFILMVIINLRILGFQFIAFYFFFYALGFFIRCYRLRISRQLSFTIGFFWFLTAIFWHGHEVPFPLIKFTMIPEVLLIYGYRLLSATLGSVFVLSISPYIFTSIQSKSNIVLCFLGKLSLGIYVIHMFVAQMIDHYFLLESIFPDRTSIIFELLFFVVCITIGVGLSTILAKNNFTNRYFLGNI